MVAPFSRIFAASDGTFGTISIDPIGDALDEIRIEIQDPSSAFIAAADVHAGSVKRLEYRAKDGRRITHRLIRSTNLVGFFERWALLAEQSFRAQAEGDLRLSLAIFTGGPEGRSAEELLEGLEEVLETHRSTSQRRRLRGQEAHDLLVQVVDAYKQAVADGDPSPRSTIARRLGYSSEHIGRLLVKARRTDPPLLGPARRGRAGEDHS